MSAQDDAARQEDEQFEAFMRQNFPRAATPAAVQAPAPPPPTPEPAPPQEPEHQAPTPPAHPDLHAGPRTTVEVDDAAAVDAYAAAHWPSAR